MTMAKSWVMMMHQTDKEHEIEFSTVSWNRRQTATCQKIAAKIAAFPSDALIFKTHVLSNPNSRKSLPMFEDFCSVIFFIH